MKKIKLTQGKYALVDDEDFDFLNQWKWYIKKNKNVLYARCNQWDKKSKKNKPILMHRLIMNCPKLKQIDHKNRNGLDNRKDNLRICNASENGMNRGIQKNSTSGYKGVTWRKTRKQWEVFIKVNKRKIFLGYFKSVLNAAKVYNEAAEKYHGRFAWLNPV